MSQADRDRWNARYRSAPADRREAPSSFLTSLEELLPRAGRALDVAGGVGTDAVWLARRGLQVMLVDIAEEALARAAAAAAAAGVELATEQLDLESDPLPGGPWDLVTCFNFLDRGIFPAIAERLAVGGTFVYSQPTRKNLERHAHPSARFLLEEGELVKLVGELEIVRSEEGWFEGRHEARVVARKR